MMNGSKIRLSILTFVILVLFAASWTLSKSILQDVPVVHAVGARLWATSVALWLVVAFVRFRARGADTTRPTTGRLFVLSLLGFSLYFWLSFRSLGSLRASDLTVVLSSIPAMTYVIGVLFGFVGFSWKKTLGVVAVSAGALMFNLGDGGIAGAWSGVAYAALAALAYSLYGLLSQRWLKGVAIVPAVAWMTFWAALTSLVAVFLDGQSLQGITPLRWGQLIALGAVFSAPVYVLYQRIVREGGVVYANAVGVLAPVFVVVFEVLQGDMKSLEAGKLMSLLVVTAGVLLLLVDGAGGQRKG